MARPKDLEKRRFWGAQLRAWQRSGLTQAEFCRRQGLRRRLFRSWKRRLGPPDRAAGGNAALPVRFVPVALRPEVSAPAPIATHPTTALTLVTRAGHRIEVGDGFLPETLARLLGSLERPCCSPWLPAPRSTWRPAPPICAAPSTVCRSWWRRN